jgi:peptide/nickel transport system ATP-binding protein
MTTNALTSETAPLLAVEGLEVRFPVGRGSGNAHWIAPVNHVSFSLARHETMALVGESGSGKTTLGRTLVRLLKPYAGRILYKGHDVASWRGRQLAEYHKSVQLVFQDPYGSLNPVHTVGTQLALPLRLHRHSSSRITEHIEELLQQVGLVPPTEIRQKYPHELSGGQRQRVAIARALAVNPEFMVADEPISMLDVSIRAGILHLLERLNQDYGLSLVYITHDLASAWYIARKMLVMYAGTIVETGPSADIVNQPAHPYTQLLLAATPGSSMSGPLPETSTRPQNLLIDRVGCAFYERCPHAMERCHKESPPLIEVTPDRFAACFLHDR